MLRVSNAAIMVVVTTIFNFIVFGIVITLMSEILPQDYWAHINLTTVYAQC